MCPQRQAQRSYHLSAGDTWHRARHAGSLGVEVGRGGPDWERGGDLAGGGHPWMRGHSQVQRLGICPEFALGGVERDAQTPGWPHGSITRAWEGGGTAAKKEGFQGRRHPK